MATSVTARETISSLRHQIAKIEGRLSERLAPADDETVVLRGNGRVIDPSGRLITGVPALDEALAGGLPKAALIEIHGRQVRDAGAVAGFVLALASLLSKQMLERNKPPLLWIGSGGLFAGTGVPHLHGIVRQFGIESRTLLFAETPRPVDALWIAEEAAALRTLGAVILELPGNPRQLDLTATRRLHRRAAEAGPACFPAQTLGKKRRQRLRPYVSSSRRHLRACGAFSGDRLKARSARPPLPSIWTRTVLRHLLALFWNGTPMTMFSNSEYPTTRKPRSILSLWFPYLSVERIWRQRLGPTWRSANSAFPPLVISRNENGTQRLVALDARAEALNLRRGMGVADARAMHPCLDVVEADPQADRRLLEALADWCDRYTPLVALDGADGLFLDITGCSHLFDGEEALVAEMTRRFEKQGFDARIAGASTAGTAWAVARFHGGAVIPDCEEAEWLRPLPLAALRLDRAVCAGLESVGLRTIGAVMAAPRAPLVRRFGKMLVLRLDQAIGALEEALSPRMPVPELSAERHLAEPIMTLEDVERIIPLLAGSLQEALERRATGALTLQLLLFRVDGAVSRLTVGMSRPTRAPERIRRLFHERVGALSNSLDVGYGFDLIRLSVLSFGVLAPEQIDFADEAADAAADLALFVDRVGARLGRDVIRRPVAIASHIPERSVSLAPFAEAFGLQLPMAPGERPLRLLHRPESVEVMAEVPEGPPLNFRWRRAGYRIARAEGPERISPEWWMEPSPSVERVNGETDEEYENRCRRAVTEGPGRQTRDYFRVEDGDGRRYWLYRQGLYGLSETSPRWFLHGIFA